MTNFDAYFMVDWSANDKPKRGKDSVWYCLVTRRAGKAAIERSANPPTRYDAVSEIGDQLAQLRSGRMRTLVGFDFAYGYPVGFAEALGLSGGPPWRMIWDYLSFHIKDNADNKSNRFEVASATNERISGGIYPFWGCPRGRRYKHLVPTRPQRHSAKDLGDLRLTDQRAQGAQSVWKLCYPGSVGSQALLGIPHLLRLRSDPRLAAHSVVWPFDTGLQAPSKKHDNDALIVHAEIFPPMIDHKVCDGEVRDYTQVRNLALYYAKSDERGDLSKWFNGPFDLTNEQKSQVVGHEGWILGIEAFPNEN